MLFLFCSDWVYHFTLLGPGHGLHVLGPSLLLSGPGTGAHSYVQTVLIYLLFASQDGDPVQIIKQFRCYALLKSTPTSMYLGLQYTQPMFSFVIFLYDFPLPNQIPL